MKPLIKKGAFFAAVLGLVYIYFALLLYFTCKNILCFKEGVAAFLGDGSWVIRTVSVPAGLSEICSLWLSQWFVTPLAAAAVGALLLTFVAAISLAIARRMNIGQWQTLLVLAPASALALMSCDVDYNLSGTVAYAFMTVAILSLCFIRHRLLRLLVSAVGCIIMAWCAGSVVMLYSIVVVNIELLRDFRRGWIYVLLPVIAYCMAIYFVGQGYYRNLSYALLPYSFYAQWSSADANALLPWVVTIVVVNLGALLRLLPGAKGWIYQEAVGACVLVGVIIAGFRWCYDPERDAVARLSYLSSQQSWSQIIEEYQNMPNDNPTLQNIHNLALAEKDMLNDVLFRSPCYGVVSLHNSEDKSPYTYMTLSDVYYSMGLIALAKKYAFEANEAFGNYSPRMLKRLVDTNIITGEMAVARKYISLLEHTSRYKAWAHERSKMATGELALTPDLSAKRACVFPDDRFAGYHGIDDDMLQALRANNSHSTTLQYLCAYYMLCKSVPRVVGVVEEFRGTPAVRIPLPEHLQEAVVVDAIVNGSSIDAEYEIHPSVMERCRMFWAEHQPQPFTLWHYLRNSH